MKALFRTALRGACPNRLKSDFLPLSVVTLVFTIVASGLCWLGIVMTLASDYAGYAHYYLSTQIYGISVLGILYVSFASLFVLGLFGLLWDKRFFAIITLIMTVGNCVNLSILDRVTQHQLQETIRYLESYLASSNETNMPRWWREHQINQYEKAISLWIDTENEIPVFSKKLTKEVMQDTLDKFDRIANSDSGHLIEVLLSEDFVFTHKRQGEHGPESHTFNKKDMVALMMKAATGDYAIVASQHTIIDIDIPSDGKTAIAHTVGTHTSNEYRAGVYDFTLNSEIFTFEINSNRVHISRREMEWIERVQGYIYD